MKYFDIPAAKKAGMTDQQIQSFMQQNNLQPAQQSWLTEGETGLKGAWRGAMNLMNLPSYAIGGGLRGMSGFKDEREMKADPITGKMTPQTDLNRLKKGFVRNVGEGIARGIPEKSAVFNELPRSLDMQEGSLPAMAMGFAGEMVTPSTLSLLGSGAKMLGLFNKKAKVADLADDLFKGVDAKSDAVKGKGLLTKGADRLRQYSEDTVTKGLGRNKKMESFLNQVKKAGMTPEELFDRYDLWSRDPDDVQAAITMVDNKLKAVAKQSQRSVDVRDVIKLFDDEIAKLSSEAMESDSARIAQQVLSDRKQKFVEKIGQNIDGARSTPLQTSLGSVYETGSRAATDMPQSSWNLGAAESANAKGLKKTWGAIRDFVGQQTGGQSKKLGNEMSALMNLKELTRKAQTASAGNQQFPIKSIMSGMAGGGVFGIPGAVGGYIANQVAQSPTGAKAISRTARAGADFLQKASTQAPKMPRITQAVRPAMKAVQSIPRPIYKGVETVARVQPSFEDQRKKKKNYPSYY